MEFAALSKKQQVVSPTRPSSKLEIMSACRYFRYVNRLEPFFRVIREAAPVDLHGGNVLEDI